MSRLRSALDDGPAQDLPPLVPPYFVFDHDETQHGPIDDGDEAEQLAHDLLTAADSDGLILEPGSIYVQDSEGTFVAAPMSDSQTMYRCGYG